MTFMKILNLANNDNLRYLLDSNHHECPLLNAAYTTV
jgi:hypothetical protein